MDIQETSFIAFSNLEKNSWNRQKNKSRWPDFHFTHDEIKTFEPSSNSVFDSYAS